MHTQVGKWGNSLAVRIPGTYAKELDLEEGMDLEVTRVDGGLLLRPRKRAYTLDENGNVSYVQGPRTLDSQAPLVVERLWRGDS